MDKNPGAQMYFFSSKAKKNYAEVEYPDNVYLVFGCETRGLPTELVKANIDRAVRIPMRPTLRCLNLSNAVAIAVYETLRQWDFEDLK